VQVLNAIRLRRRQVVGLLALSALGQFSLPGTRAVSAQTGVVTPDGRTYKAYVPAATKAGQFYQYSCEFDASWVVLSTFGHDVPFEEQLAIVGHDLSIEPYSEQTADGFVIYGGDVTSAFSGDYTSNYLARTTGMAMLPLFKAYDLDAALVETRAEIEQTLDQGGLIWSKATVDFLPWDPTTWVTPEGKALPTVLGNDHAVVVMGYDDDVVVIRDVLGPTNTNWDRTQEYEVPWDTYLAVFEAQGVDGVGVLPPGTSRSTTIQQSTTIQPSTIIQPVDSATTDGPDVALQICC
jgi:uncharacterized protein YvpB